jgi:hypothetical protein
MLTTWSGFCIPGRSMDCFGQLNTWLSRSRWPRGLSRRPWSLGCWDCGFESLWGHGCLSLLLSCVGRDLCDEMIPRPNESYHVSNKDSETQKGHRKTSIDVLTRKIILDQGMRGQMLFVVQFNWATSEWTKTGIGRWGETMSLNWGHQRACTSSPREIWAWRTMVCVVILIRPATNRLSHRTALG